MLFFLEHFETPTPSKVASLRWYASRFPAILTNYRQIRPLYSRSPSVPVVYTLWSALGRTSLPRRGTAETTLARARNPADKNETLSKPEIPIAWGIRLTFLRSTPHRVKSVTNRLYVSNDASDRSARIWQTGSIIGSTDRSSANSGCPLKPSGFFNRADIMSLTPISALPTRSESVENEHCISDTENARGSNNKTS